MTDIRTVNLSGTELAVTDISGANICIKNSGSETLYASAHSGVTADAPGVLPVDPGTSAILPDCKGAVYLLGRGKAVLAGGDTKFNLFSPAPGNGSGDSGAPVGCELIRCETRHAEIAKVLDLSGAKYFGIRPTSAVGVYVALLAGGTHQNEELIWVPSAGGCFIREVPVSGNIFVDEIHETYVLYTSNSYSAIENACRIELTGWTDIREETT